MDTISEIVDTFSEEDKKEFRDFLNRYRKRKDRKDLQLFDQLASNRNSKRDKLISGMYPDNNNLEAYHATRKRLLRQLLEYVQLKKRNGETTSDGYIESLVSMSGYLFDQARHKAAWSMLRQAEELAKKGENFKILSDIYSIQVEQSQSEHAPDLREILTRKKMYQGLALEDENANIAYHLIRYELNQSLSTGKEINIADTIRQILKEYGLTEIVTERPRLMYNIIAITRSAVLAGKDYFSFEPYIIEKYSEIVQKDGFNKYNHYYKIHLLYMIAHVLYRNKKFTASEQYLEHLYKSLQEYNKSHFLQLYPKYNLLLAAVYNYSGRNSEAIDLLEKLVSGKKVKLDKSALLNTYLNLSTYYFQREDYTRSVRVFQNVQHSDKWLMKIMGFEWVLKKNIIECINQFELGNSDLVEQRLNSLEKNFKDYFLRSLYKRVSTFLALVRQLNNDPACATTREFYQQVEASFDFVEVEKEDIQAMTFYGWLKAKMQRRKYYEVLLELVGQR